MSLLHSFYQQIKTSYNPWITSERYPHEKMIDKIIYKIPENSMILDVGCFTGKLLSIHQQHQLHGVEPSIEGALVASTENKIKIIGESVTEELAEVYSGKFEIITLIDVFEHLLNPTEYLQLLFKMLKVNGQLIIVTGRTDSYMFNTIGPSYWYVNIEPHLVFLNKKYLGKLPIKNFTLKYLPVRHYHTSIQKAAKEILWAIIWCTLSPNNKNKRITLPHFLTRPFNRFRSPMQLTFPKDHVLAQLKKT